MKNPSLALAAIVAALLCFTPGGAVSPAAAQEAAPLSGPGSALQIPKALLIQPADLNRILAAPSGSKPLVLQVGSHVLYAEAHIPGSEYAGPGADPDGLARLKTRVNSLPRSQWIVIYCGCCPWNHCPNAGPAFSRLKQMGFTNIKVLYLADNFGANWVAKGYPAEKGR